MTAQDFGALIRARREAKGLSVEEIAARIKLSARALRSIEEGVLDGLPHAVYARGFVRSYGTSVGLSEEELNQGLSAIFPSAMFDEANPQPGPIDRQRNSKGKGGMDRLLAMCIVLVLLVLPIGAGWFVITQYGGDIMALVKRTFSASQSGAKTETSAPAMSAAVAGAERPGNTTRQAQNPTPTAASAVRENPYVPPAANATAAATVAVAAPAPQHNATASVNTAAAVADPVPAGDKAVVVEANANCWVKATADGAEGRRITVKAGETSVFPFKKTLVITLGNSGGVQLRYNGKPYPVSTKAGDVKTYMFPPKP